jgi:TolA-binding protein
MGIKKRVPRKSTIKKEIEEILTPTQKIRNFLEANMKQTFFLLGALIVIAGALFLWRAYTGNLETKAGAIISDAFNHYAFAMERDNPQEYRTAVDKFTQLVNTYPGTSIGKNALLYLGNCYFSLREFTNASKNYTLFLEKSSRSEKTLRAMAYEGLGYASEEAGKVDKAAEYFKKATEEGPAMNELALMNLARSYEELKQNGKAIETYQKVIRDYPQSENVPMARERVATLNKATQK